MTQDEEIRERLIQAHIEGYNKGYDECISKVLKSINRLHDSEFYALAKLIESDNTEDLPIKIARKTWEVATLEKVRDGLEALK